MACPLSDDASSDHKVRYFCLMCYQIVARCRTHCRVSSQSSCRMAELAGGTSLFGSHRGVTSACKELCGIDSKLPRPVRKPIPLPYPILPYLLTSPMLWPGRHGIHLRAAGVQRRRGPLQKVFLAIWSGAQLSWVRASVSAAKLRATAFYMY